MRYLFAASLLLASSLAIAGETTRIGRNIITIGMSSMDARNRAGAPKYSEDVVNRLGAKIGEKWSYQDGRRAITLTISGGAVVAIDESLM